MPPGLPYQVSRTPSWDFCEDSVTRVWSELHQRQAPTEHGLGLIDRFAEKPWTATFTRREARNIDIDKIPRNNRYYKNRNGGKRLPIGCLPGTMKGLNNDLEFTRHF